MTTDCLSPEDQIVRSAVVPHGPLVEAFETAAADPQVATRHLDIRIAGFHVRIRVAGAALGEVLLAPLGHHAAASGGAPDLCIDVLDGDTAGFESKSAAGAGPYGILLRSSEDGRFVGESRRHTEIWLDRQRAHIAGWFQSVDLLNLDELARPFHKMLSCWLEERGVQFIHAGLITHRDTGLLFVGNGGAGKSTSSIACMLAGMGYLGDDFVGFSAAADGFCGHGIYASCLLDAGHIRRFPALERISRPANHAFETKRIMYLQQDYADRLQSDVALRALLLPRVVDAVETRVRPASKAQALMAIAPTSVMLLPRPSRAAFARLSALVERLPCYWLELGRDVAGIPGAVARLAEEP